jgi:26S proteasome regulatory subunit N12
VEFDFGTKHLIMAALKDVVNKAQVLKQEWSKTPCNLKKCGELLNQLKVR